MSYAVVRAVEVTPCEDYMQFIVKVSFLHGVFSWYSGFPLFLKTSASNSNSIWIVPTLVKRVLLVLVPRMLVRVKLKLNPQGIHIKTDITAFFVNFFMHSPKRDRMGKYTDFRLNTLSETKICNLHPKARRRVSPSLLYGSPPPGGGGVGACHSRFAVFFPLSSFCISSLLYINAPSIIIRIIQEMETSKTSS